MKRHFYISLCAVILLLRTDLCCRQNSRSKGFLRELSKKEACEDLDQLERLLENHYSYLKLKGIDYKAALSGIRSSLDDRISRNEFGRQLRIFLALFGDGHSIVASSSLALRSLCLGFLPFLVEESDGRFVAFKPDRSDFVDQDFPFLRRLDGLPVKTWLEAASQWVAKGSPQFLRYHSIRNLRYIECLRKELGLDKSASIQVELESTDGTSMKQIKMTLAKKGPSYGFWPRPENENKTIDVPIESRIIQENIGYLRMFVMSAQPEFLNRLLETMKQFKGTKGLIIDARLCNGGRRAPLQVLFPFFMAENDLPRVLNVAAYRLGTKNIKEDFEARYLYPIESSQWSVVERGIINRFAETFQPEWSPPKGQFSEWHYFVIGPTNHEPYYRYDKSVVILMDRWNFSSWDIFLGAFKGWRNITLMGSPSGGGSGCYQIYRLRHSHIKIHLSSMVSFQPNGKLYDGNGIEPDIFIEPIPTDFIGKTDTILEAAIERIQQAS